MAALEPVLSTGEVISTARTIIKSRTQIRCLLWREPVAKASAREFLNHCERVASAALEEVVRQTAAHVTRAVAPVREPRGHLSDAQPTRLREPRLLACRWVRPLHVPRVPLGENPTARHAL